jgi:arylsulfatase A-like enzyme
VKEANPVAVHIRQQSCVSIEIVLIGEMSMTRVAFVLLTGVVALAPASGAEPPRKPNIVFILADDLGPGDLGFTGGKIAPTPNIDRLAADGIQFTRYYTAAPICSPSRCGLVTGQFPARWRITSFLQTRAGNAGCGQADFLDAAAPSLPRSLKAAGYRTAHFGKWHLGGGRDVLNPPKFAAYGYDEHAGTYESPEPHPAVTATNWIWSDKDPIKRWDRTAFFVDRTLDFLTRHRGNPCFVNLWLDDPHTPWVPDAAAGKNGNSADKLRKVLAENDRQVGRLIAGLKDLGLEANTLVVFTSDNGPLPTLHSTRSGGLRGCKLSLYEGGIRVPFVARWPGVIPAGRTDELTVLAAVDLFPTFCQLATVPLPDKPQLDGEDRSAALRGTSLKTRSRPLFWEYGRNDKFFAYPTLKNGARASDRSPNLAVLDGSWKLLVDDDGEGVELYNVSADRNESRNRVKDQPDLVKRLMQVALDWRKSLP